MEKSSLLSLKILLVLAVLGALEYLFIEKGLIAPSFLNCTILQAGVMFILFCFLFEIAKILAPPKKSKNKILIIPALCILMLFVYLALPGIELYFYFHPGLPTDATFKFVSPYSIKTNILSVYVSSMRDAIYGGFFLGTPLGFILGIIYERKYSK